MSYDRRTGVNCHEPSAVLMEPAVCASQSPLKFPTVLGCFPAGACGGLGYLDGGCKVPRARTCPDTICDASVT